MGDREKLLEALIVVFINESGLDDEDLARFMKCECLMCQTMVRMYRITEAAMERGAENCLH